MARAAVNSQSAVGDGGAEADLGLIQAKEVFVSPKSSSTHYQSPAVRIGRILVTTCPSGRGSGERPGSPATGVTAISSQCRRTAMSIRQHHFRYSGVRGTMIGYAYDPGPGYGWYQERC